LRPTGLLAWRSEYFASRLFGGLKEGSSDKVVLQYSSKIDSLSLPLSQLYFFWKSPQQALLHLRMFAMFGQFCRLRDGDNILPKRVLYVLSTGNSKSWFWRLRTLCMKYGLPHPISWLSSKPIKLQVKKAAKAGVLD